jgi:hypothetical protein
MTKETSNKFITKVGLPKIVEGINRTLEAYEDGIYDDQALDEIMSDILVDLRNSVDIRISILGYLGGQSVGDKPGSGVIGKAQELYRAYREKMEIAERLRDRIKSQTLAIIESNRDIKFEGNLGRLASQASPAKLVIDLKLDSKNFNYLISPDDPDLMQIPEKYLKVITTMQIDTEKLKQDLQAGEFVPWARLEKGTHLRVRY